MRKVIASLLAVVGTSAAANAQGLVQFKVSTDGINFSNTVNAAPGTTVSVRAFVSYTGVGTVPALGLASLAFQPTVSNFIVGSSMLALANGGLSSNVTNAAGMVNSADADGLNGPWGRIFPWGRTNQTLLATGHVQTGPGPATNPTPAGRWLRIASTTTTSWIGGTGNTTGNGGVSIAQLNSVGRTTNDPAFEPGLEDLFVFTWAITVGLGAVDTMVIDAPLGGFGNRNTVNGVREVRWYASMTETAGSIVGAATVETASIVIPTPASLALLGLGGLIMTRRRR